MTPRVGLLGGTFDPPHVAHLVVAREVLEAMGLDEVRLVVAQHPPHKPGRTPEPGEVRARMLEACLEKQEPGDTAGLVVDRIELEREAPSWTVETLRALHAREPGTEWYLILGADQLAAFATWREPEEIARLATLVVVARGGTDPAEVEPGIDARRVTSVPVTRMDVSSTELRRRIREGRSVRWLVPGPALRIIEDEGLYAGGHGRSDET